ncbi:MAG: Spy/CpxP family protein refolding chaperone [Acidobacteriota bacterium]|nr:Spy/CpxP family protein refolding chaperone [Acidobacteriota bacterium]
MNHNLFQKKLFGAATMILAGALAAGTAIAQPAPGGPGKFARGIRAAMATLDLTDAQKDRVKAIFASHKDEGMAFHAQAKADREALKAAASAPNPDAAVVGAAFLKVRADGEAARAKMKAVHAEINAVLTPEQRARLDGWIAAHKQQRGMLRGGRQS